MAIKKQRKQSSEDSVDQLLKYFIKKMSYPDDGTRDNKKLLNINNTKQKFQESTLLQEFMSSRKMPQGASSTRVERKSRRNVCDVRQF